MATMPIDSVHAPQHKRCVVSCLALALMLSGCASTSPEPLFHDVAYTVEKRSGNRIAWQAGPYTDPAADAVIRGLLSKPLTARAAVQVALLNNRELQANYAELGIAQAALVQAKTPPNPVLDGAITFPEDGGTNLAFGLAMNVIQVLYIPLKARVAESQIEEAKLKVASEVLGVATRTHLAFIDYQASQQTIELLTQVIESTRASVTAAKALREAGNTTALEFESQSAQLTEAKLELAAAETRSVEARERLNLLLGLHGAQTRWTAPGRLPDPPGRDINLQQAERRAIKANLELASARQGLITLARKYRLEKANAIVPDLEAGGEWERDDGEKEGGPIFEVQLPIFDRGRARKAAAQMEIIRARDNYTALAVRIRSAARLAVASLQNSRAAATYYRETVIPQSARLLDETLKEYNAMQRGVFNLIQAKERQIRAGERYVEALANYWKARVRFAALMQGVMPPEGGAAPAPRGAAQVANAGGH
ncbi:MAG: TolC family protein [Pseudomonadota bacterium]|nr:TolC family protein [Pseudomonadota bacterium]